MKMSICTHEARPLNIEVFGLSLSLSGLEPGCPVIVTDTAGGLTVSIGAAEPEVLPEAAATPEPEALPEAVATPEPEALPEAAATPKPEALPEAAATPPD